MSPRHPDSPAERFRALVESSDDAIIGKDRDGTITSWNRAAQRLLHYTAEEAIGQSAHLIVPAHLQADEDERLRKVTAGEAVPRHDTVRRLKSGELVHVSVTTSPMRASTGDVIGAAEIARDVTDRRRAEGDASRLISIVESSDDAIISKDLNGIVTSWNRGAEGMFGYTAAEMIGRSIRVIIPGNRQAEEDEVLARVRRGQRVDHYETFRLRREGTVFPISLTVSPILDAQGVVIGASKIARDITERRQADADRLHLLALARESSRLKDEFLATLSHELRTPLNAILGYARMIRTDLLAAEQKARGLETIERNARVLTQLVEDVLDVSRIVSGKIRLDVQPVDLAAVIGDALETVRPAADARGVRVEVVLDADAGPVACDSARVQQVIWNVLSNAVKFTERGGRVRVRLQRANGHLEVAVSDTGIGIRPEFLPHLFERFRQADSSTTRERGGLGLGLAIARHLVELHGGTIHATSGGEGQGATFVIKLPLRAVPVEAPPDDHRGRQAPDVADRVPIANLHGVRVLIVDDDRDTLDMVHDLLRAAGADVRCAESAARALELLEMAPPDVMLADLAMPHMDGFALIEQVRRSATRTLRDMPAAALTAFVRSEDGVKALRSGFQLHLSKPIEPEALVAAVATLAQRTHLSA